jgi:hypothetical protein
MDFALNGDWHRKVLSRAMAGPHQACRPKHRRYATMI